MDNKSRIIGAAVVVAVVLAIVVIVAIERSRSKNKYNDCKVLSDSPKVDSNAPILSTSDNSTLARFAAHLQYPQGDNTSKYVKLVANSVTSSSKTNLVIGADCGTLTLTLEEDNKTGAHYATSVKVVAAGVDQEKTCSLSKGKLFEVPKESRYKCEKSIAYDCVDEKNAKVAILNINVLEFDVGTSKPTPTWTHGQNVAVCT